MKLRKSIITAALLLTTLVSTQAMKPSSDTLRRSATLMSGGTDSGFSGPVDGPLYFTAAGKEHKLQSEAERVLKRSYEIWQKAGERIPHFTTGRDIYDSWGREINGLKNDVSRGVCKPSSTIECCISIAARYFPEEFRRDLYYRRPDGTLTNVLPCVQRTIPSSVYEEYRRAHKVFMQQQGHHIYPGAAPFTPIRPSALWPTPIASLTSQATPAAVIPGFTPMPIRADSPLASVLRAEQQLREFTAHVATIDPMKSALGSGFGTPVSREQLKQGALTAGTVTSLGK